MQGTQKTQQTQETNKPERNIQAVFNVQFLAFCKLHCMNSTDLIIVVVVVVFTPNKYFFLGVAPIRLNSLFKNPRSGPRFRIQLP